MKLTRPLWLILLLPLLATGCKSDADLDDQIASRKTPAGQSQDADQDENDQD
jgi:hypothetical protein